MVSMKLSPAEKNDYEVTSIESDAPEYPWGLSIGLNGESLKKLGKSSSDFDLGDEIEMTIKVKVKGLSSSKYEGDSDGHESVDLQICEMELKDGNSDTRRISRMYGDDDDGEY